MKNWKAMTYAKRITTILNKFKQSLKPDPTNEDIVRSLVLNTASLALKKGTYVEFAPIKGTCGTIQLSGNSLPVFEYTVFEKSIMEFIAVRVEVSRPDRIHFASVIKSQDQTTHGQKVETKEKYEAPFWKLCSHITQYFPFPMNGGSHVINQGLPAENLGETESTAAKGTDVWVQSGTQGRPESLPWQTGDHPRSE